MTGCIKQKTSTLLYTVHSMYVHNELILPQLKQDVAITCDGREILLSEGRERTGIWQAEVDEGKKQ